MVVVNEFFFFLVFFYHPTVNQRTSGARAILRVVSSVVVCTFFRICSTCLSLREGVCFSPDHFFVFRLWTIFTDCNYFPYFFLLLSSLVRFFSFFNALHNKEEGKFCFFFFYLARSFSFKYFSYVFCGSLEIGSLFISCFFKRRHICCPSIRGSGFCGKGRERRCNIILFLFFCSPSLPLFS